MVIKGAGSRAVRSSVSSLLARFSRKDGAEAEAEAEVEAE